MTCLAKTTLILSPGTDIASTFVSGSPMSPVHGNLISCKTLGMKISILDPLDGEDIEKTGEPGELICSTSFPTQPLFFWGKDKKAMQAKYKESYYTRFDENENGNGRVCGLKATSLEETSRMAVLWKSWVDLMVF